MAREVANVQTALWGSPDWKQLHVLEQWLYLHLLSHPSLTYAGVADWFPKRLAAAGAGINAEKAVELARGLESQRFVFIAEETDEILIRSFLRHDGLLKQPKLSVSMAKAFAAIASTEIQQIVVYELQKLRREHPEWKAFESEKVRTILKLEGADMDEFRVNRGEDLALDLGLALPQTSGNGLPIGLPLRTATSTSTSSKDDGSDAQRKRSATKKSPPSPEEKHITEVATTAYEAIGKSGAFMGIRQIAKWCVNDRGLTAEQFRDAVVAVYQMGKPITKQVIGQFIDGHLGSRAPNRTTQKQQDQMQVIRNLEAMDEQEAQNQLEAG